MKKNILSAAVIAIIGWASASAVQVQNTAGNLSSAGIDPSETILKVTGEINAADIDYINKSLTSLVSLDLSAVDILPYSGDAVLFNRNSFPADLIPDYAFAGSRIQSIALPLSTQAIGEGAFTSSAITAMTIPSNVTEIGNAAFSNCDNLTSIAIPATVTDLGENLLKGCDALQSVDISGLTSSIPKGICSGCSALTSVNMPASNIATIGAEAFEGCSSLQTVAFPALLEEIGDHAFANSGITSVDLEGFQNITAIGAWAFSGCKDLVTVNLDDNIIRVGEGAFFDSGIEEYKGASRTRKISDYTFTNANKVNGENVLPEGVTEIGRFAFAGWDQITDFTLPSTLTKIDDNAFESWTSLKNLHAEALSSVPRLGREVWNNVDQANATLVVKEELISDFQAAEQWQLFHIDTTGVVAVTADKDGEANVKVMFEGMTMRFSADVEIADVAVFDTQGRKYAFARPNANVYSIDTTDWSAPVYLIAVRLADGQEASFKLARR